MTPDQIISHHWDVIVIGTGMGGATAGYSLVQGGKAVLFVEKGASHLGNSDTIAGEWPEMRAAGTSGEKLVTRLARGGRMLQVVTDSQAPGKPFMPIMGEGTGGSSALYGMVLERFYPVDFAPGAAGLTAPGADIPERWPVSIEEMLPYYLKAENLYHVKGSKDATRPPEHPRGVGAPPAYSPTSAELEEYLRSQGLNPYHMQMACDYKPGCNECVGFICDKACKGDSARMCLEPALKHPDAALLDQCEVLKLEANRVRVTGVICRWRGRQITLRGTTVLLAAGGLQSPAILLRSASALWPNGLANGSGKVGRYLMRHPLDYYFLKPRRPPRKGELIKQVAFNDFYFKDGLKLGNVQANGQLPPSKIIVRSLKEDLDRKAPFLGMLIGLLRPLIEWAAAQSLKDRIVLAAFLEDFPYADNRIMVAADGALIVHYSLGESERERLAKYRKAMMKLLAPFKPKLNGSGGENSSMLSHICGTCRFGDSPDDSVLDRNNKAHELENLYVVDASFFPTSSGINPSLTIAANALRVADHLSGRVN